MARWRKRTGTPEVGVACAGGKGEDERIRVVRKLGEGAVLHREGRNYTPAFSNDIRRDLAPFGGDLLVGCC